ncbi:MAG: polyprenyl synthetase family protein [Propionibacteriaceae bacterium]|nr:polyprenyl synthetase family protein [Propionibacteriaceae bacterium]
MSEGASTVERLMVFNGGMWTLADTHPALLGGWLIDVERELSSVLQNLTDRMRAMHPDAAVMGEALSRAALGGKLIRPRLLGAVVESYGGSLDDSASRVSVALELLHTCLVVHDDVIDDDLTRRGRPNVAGEFAAMHSQRSGHRIDHGAGRSDAKGIAVIAGDLALATVFKLVRRAPVAVLEEVSDLVDEALVASVVGEYLDVVHSWPGAEPTDSDMRVAAHLKTAVYSFETPLVVGALLVDAPTPHIAAMRAAARDMGEAYQVVDDVLGAFEHDTVLGREIASDLENHRETAVITAARGTSHWPRIELLRASPLNVHGIAQLRHELLESGARELAMDRADQLLRRAFEALDEVGVPPQLRVELNDLLESIMGRAR